ncbi:MAG: NAD-dependent epimerase/dehydratase family protein [Bacteroidota bacterium]
MKQQTSKRIMITGAAGYLGRLICQRLMDQIQEGAPFLLFGTDIQENPFPKAGPYWNYLQTDIRSASVLGWMADQQIEVLYHLAAILSPPPGMSRATQHEIDVLATQHLIRKGLQHQLRRCIVTSSGAAYGYRADNPRWLKEEHPLRPNEDYAYSWHKYLVEEFLQQQLKKHPGFEVFTFRVGTILGETTNNPITQMMQRDPVILVKESETPFVAIWDRDVVNIFEKALNHPIPGIYNVAGDGVIPLAEIAAWQGSKVKRFSSRGLKRLFWWLKTLRLSPYGPDQVKFIEFRPVLDNTKLKTVFGYTPEKNSAEVIRFYLNAQNRLQ